MNVSVVVADVHAPQSLEDEALRALRAALMPGDDEVILVTARPRPSAVARVVEAPDGAGRGDLYGAGLRHATGGVVAFTDTASVVQPGWRDAMLGAFARGAQVVGGPVLPPPSPGAIGWAGFLLEYGPHAVAPYTSATGDVAANNVAYDAALLARHGDGTVWKHELNRALRAAGTHVTVEPGMRVVAAKRYDLGAVVERRAHAVRYAQMLAAGWSRPARLLHALACAALPFLVVARVLRTVAPVRAWWARTVVALPFLVAGALAWSVGEATGFAFPSAAPGRVV